MSIEFIAGLLPSIILGGLVIILYLISLNKDKEKTVNAIKKSLKIFITALPLFTVALILTGLFYSDIIMPPHFVETVLGSEAGIIGILIGTFLGFPLPGPRYAIYPLSAVLLQKGAGVGTITSLIMGQQIIDVPEGCFIEIKMMGTRFFLIRTLISVFVVFISGVIAEIISWFIVLNIYA
ncbi:MAG: hypothetical protein ACTSVY_12545 [Candidatus Helarchaeota archaeon]